MSKPQDVKVWSSLLEPLRKLSLQPAGEGYAAACRVVATASSGDVATTGCMNSEVVGDLLLLVQHLQQKAPAGTVAGQGPGADDTWQAEAQYCKLLVHHLGSKAVVFPAAALAILIPALRQWCFYSPGDDPACEVLQGNALQALNLLLQSCDGRVASHEQQALMVGLLTLAEEVATTARIYSGSGKAPGKTCFSEVHYLTFQVLSVMLSKFPSSDLPKDSYQCCASVAVDALDGCLGRTVRPAEEGSASRLFAAMLRCLNTAILEGRGCHVHLLQKLGMLLPRLFCYGISATRDAKPTSEPDAAQHPPAKAAPAAMKGGPGGTPAKAAYVPPHLRNATSGKGAAAPVVSLSGRRGNKSGWRGSEGSGSESDSFDGQQAAGGFVLDPHRVSRVRIAALNIIQAMVRVDIKSMQPHLRSYFPLNSPLQEHPRTPSLVTVLLYDPHAKVRLAAASAIGLLMEGPVQRAYLGVAEVRSTSAKALVRGFTPLSVQLGQMLVALHAGLFQSLQSEPNLGILTSSMRALAILLCAAPYERLPQTLIPQVVSCVRSTLRRSSAMFSSAPSSMTDPYHAAALSCLAAALSTRAPVPSLAAEMLQDVPQAGSRTGGRAPAVLHEIWQWTRAGPALVRIEALGALRGAFKNYPQAILGGLPSAHPAGDPVPPSGGGATAAELPSSSSGDDGARLEGAWQMVRATVDANMQQAASHGSAASSNPELRALQMSYRILEAFMQALSGQHEEGNGPDSEIIPSGSGGADGTVTSKSYPPNGAVTSIWTYCLQEYLPVGWRHNSAMVRAAAHLVSLKLTAEVFGALPEAQQRAVLQASVTGLSTDKEASVRAAACRCLGNLAGFTQLMTNETTMGNVVEALKAGLCDSALSVRIPASWGLGNLCSISAVCSQAPEANAQLLCLFKARLSELLEAAMQAARDSDKVRSNGVRMLGCLVALTGIDHAEAPSLEEKWIEPLLQCLLSSLTTGNVKVQWNACFSANNVLCNQAMLAHPTVVARLPGLLLVLIMLVRDCANFKIRTHASAALMSLGSRDLYGDCFADAVQVIVATLAEPAGRASAHSIKSDDAGGAKLPDASYHSLLRRQSQATLLHLFSLARDADAALLRDTLTKRRAFLLGFSRAACLAVGRPVKGLRPGAEGAALPSDPFGQDRSSAARFAEDAPIGRSADPSAAGSGGASLSEEMSLESPALFGAPLVAAALSGLTGMYSAQEPVAEQGAALRELRGLLAALQVSEAT
eukprot:jgi/Tetstr1/434266/TSEL_023373.t1